MRRPGLQVGNAFVAATACTCCLLAVVLVANPAPTSRNTSKQDHSATLVVTNDGTFRNTSTALRNVANSRLEGANQNTRRQGKQVKAKSVDISHWFKEEASDYPDDEIRQLLAKTPDVVKGLYNVLNTQLDPHMNLTERVAFYNDDEEHGGGVREESVCKSVTRNIYPREATRQNSLVYIPNNQEFMQVIQAEICQHPDRECSYLSDSLPYGMTSVCYQKYAYKKLLYLDSLDKRMASDLFRYPSCCSCYIRSLPFDLRSAGNTTILTTTASAGTPLLFHNNPAELPVSSQEEDGNNNNSTAAPPPKARESAGRSLSSQHVASGRASKPPARPSNQTVILNANKVFEANK